MGHRLRTKTEQRNQAESGQEQFFHSAEFDVARRTLFIFSRKSPAGLETRCGGIKLQSYGDTEN